MCAWATVHTSHRGASAASTYASPYVERTAAGACAPEPAAARTEPLLGLALGLTVLEAAHIARVSVKASGSKVAASVAAAAAAVADRPAVPRAASAVAFAA